jgi:putative DNA primase/helicase
MSALRRDIKVECRGKWASVFVALGMSANLFNGRHHPCPFCQDKWPRFRWDRKKEYAICSRHGAWQPIDLAMEWLDLPFKETTLVIRNEKIETMTPIEQVDDAKILKENHDKLKFIHKGLKPITPNGVVAKYLAKRGITVLPEKDVYEHNNIAYYGPRPDENTPVIGVFNAMVARVTDVESNMMVQYHVTYLTVDGKKIDFAQSKIRTGAIKSSKGSSIKMFTPTEILAVSESIENSLAFHADTGYPVWSCQNAQGLINVQIPESVKEVIIIEDSDKSFTGQMAAATLANRLTVKEGKSVRIIKMVDLGKGLEQMVEQGLDMDFNDFILSQTIRDRKTA